MKANIDFGRPIGRLSVACLILAVSLPLAALANGQDFQALRESAQALNPKFLCYPDSEASRSGGEPRGEGGFGVDAMILSTM